MKENTTRTTKSGAPGTLKAKIKGPVTIAKVNALKNRPGATPHDKAQANWFINMQRGKKQANEEVPSTSTANVAGAGDNPDKIVPVFVNRRKRKDDDRPAVLTRFKKYLEEK
jgi:hypothetical protein